jgi:hypothetical protein
VSGTLAAILGGTRLAFGAATHEGGLQLWLSDGTAVGTEKVSIWGGDGFGAVSIGKPFATGARAFFACDDGVTGNEPWLFDPAAGGFAFVLPYGHSCGGSTLPVASANGLPTLGNPGFAVTVSQALPLSLAVPVGSEGSTNIPLGSGCQLLLDFPLVLLAAAPIDALGDASTPLPIPSIPALIGSSLFFQWAVLDPLGPFLSTFSVSNGVQVQIGN